MLCIGLHTTKKQENKQPQTIIPAKQNYRQLLQVTAN